MYLCIIYQTSQEKNNKFFDLFFLFILQSPISLLGLDQNECGSTLSPNAFFPTTPNINNNFMAAAFGQQQQQQYNNLGTINQQLMKLRQQFSGLNEQAQNLQYFLKTNHPVSVSTSELKPSLVTMPSSSSTSIMSTGTVGTIKKSDRHIILPDVKVKITDECENTIINPRNLTAAPSILTRTTSEKIPNRSQIMNEVQRTTWARHTTK